MLFIGQSDAVALFAPGSYWDSAPRITPIQPSRPGTTVPAPPEQMLEKGVEALLATADALGLDYGVVAAPFRDGCFDTDPVLRATYRRRRENYETYTALRRKIQTVARTAAERHGAPFLDGQALVSPQHFYDLMHLNVQGQHVFAAGLTPWLERWVTGADSSSETGRATD